ncbi:MAG TPA: exostosin family protein [Thermodesulfobacteriota bacterium]|nr:exostosin family protein [Thermodesulfobacteriota bacterium]
MKVLKLYTQRRLLKNPDDYISLLYPFWGFIPEKNNSMDKNRFKEYSIEGKTFFIITDNIDSSDAVLSPIAYERPGGKETAVELSKIAGKKGKKLILFFNSDSDEDISIENVIIFRTSFYQSSRKKNEFSLPGWSDDYIKVYFHGRPQIRIKNEIPVIGYCGYTDNMIKSIEFKLNYLRGTYPISRYYNFQSLRGRAVRYLSDHKNIKGNFIIRQTFPEEQKSPIELKMDFINNLINSDYALVTRGMGNFSYRFYEILCCGRIPLFINTDAVLPYDKFIDWKKHIVWIEDKDLKHIGDILFDFHKNISPDKFHDLQINLRNIYEEWISPSGFYKNLWRCIKENIE